MSDPIPPVPPGAPNKVQPKKETVRINLPPKPSAAPTIKLPTLPPGGPSAGVPGGMQAHAATPAPAAPAARPPTHSGAAPASAAAAPKPAPRPAAASAAPTINSVDRFLIMAAGILAFVSVASTYYCITLFKD